jgi:GTP-binding protein
MLPVIALVGRPNVGKSTLFNRLTRTRDALVADRPGLTRDRQYGFGRHDAKAYAVIDTGGLMGGKSGLGALMAMQTEKALAEADAAVLLVDARAGLHPGDEQIAAELRRLDKPVWLAVNKSEGLAPALAEAEFFALGLGEPHAISAAHGDGVGALLAALLASLPAAADVEAAREQSVPVAIIGRPNAGKSTLVNRLVGEERLVTFNEPGTTRDAVFVPFERNHRRYTLIDTAGLRRRSRVRDAVEKFSIVKTLKAIEAAQVAVLVLDAQEGITEQDASLAGLALERGRAIVIAVNKWDGLSPEQRDTVRRLLDLKLAFARPVARLHFISALHGSGVGELMASIDAAHAAADRELATAALTRVLRSALERHPPPLIRGRRIRLRFAHQGGRFPPLIVVHGSRTAAVPEAYRRYLINTFRQAFALQGTPVRVVFRTGKNPYV